jgi:hypothetical protein
MLFHQSRQEPLFSDYRRCLTQIDTLGRPISSMFGTSDSEAPSGMRAMIRCAECDSPLAGVDTIGQRASVETEIEPCSDHPTASYVLAVEEL